MISIHEIIENSKLPISTKSKLFLRLCALNLLNKLVKDDIYKKEIGYNIIKSSVLYMVLNLLRYGKDALTEQIAYKPGENCIFIRCYGLQFGFHKVDKKPFEKEFPKIIDGNVVWDGVRLQPIGEPLYELAKDICKYDLDEQKIYERIEFIKQKYNA